MANKTFYVASKVANFRMWQELRKRGANIVASWIDLIDEDGKERRTPEERSHISKLCLDEAASADVLVLYANGADVLRGCFMETGAALSHGKEVRVIRRDNTYLGGILLPHPLVKEVQTFGEAFDMPSLEEPAPLSLRVEIKDKIVKKLKKKFSHLLDNPADPKASYEDLRERVSQAHQHVEKCEINLESYVLEWLRDSVGYARVGVESRHACALSPILVCVYDEKAHDPDGVQRNRCVFCGTPEHTDHGRYGDKGANTCRYCNKELPEAEIKGEYRRSVFGYNICGACVEKAHEKYGTEAWRIQLSFGCFAEIEEEC